MECQPGMSADERALDRFRIRDAALTAAIHLSASAEFGDGESRRWVARDYDALSAAMHFDYQVSTYGLPNVVEGDDRFMCARDISAWRAALPYAEPERRRLADAGEYAVGRSLPSYVRKEIREEEVLAGGITIVMRGRELMQRWWKWRRGLDEFAGHSGREEAANALARLEGRLGTVVDDLG